MARASILKVRSKNIILITYSLFHLWVLGNSNPCYPAKSITCQPLEVTNEQKAKQNSPPPPLTRERKYLRSWQPWWTRRSLLKKETGKKKKVISKHFTCPLVEGKKRKNNGTTLTPVHYTHVDKAPCLPLTAIPHHIQLHKYVRN